MKTSATRSAVALAALLVSGCARTGIHSQVNLEDSSSYKKFIVVVNVQDLGLRQTAEKRFVEKLAARGVEGVPSHVVLFPGKVYQDDEIASKLDELAVEAIVVVEPTGTGSSFHYVPPTTRTQTDARVYGNQVKGSSTTTTTGGYNVSKPWASFNARVMDASSGNIVWTASATTNGNAYAGAGNLVKSMAGKTVSQMAKDGLLRGWQLPAGSR